jgi:hypothetical protein
MAGSERPSSFRRARDGPPSRRGSSPPEPSCLRQKRVLLTLDARALTAGARRVGEWAGAKRFASRLLKDEGEEIAHATGEKTPPA